MYRSVRELKGHLKLNMLSMKTSLPIDECLSMIGTNCRKLLSFSLSIHPSVPKSLLSLDIFSEFKALKKLHLSLLNNTVLSGSVESFKHCKQLNDLDINYPKLTKHFFTDIQLFVPKLKCLQIKTRKWFSKSFDRPFHRIKSIEKVEIRVYNSNNRLIQSKFWYFGKCLSEVMLTPIGKDVKRVTDNCGLIYFNDDFKYCFKNSL